MKMDVKNISYGFKTCQVIRKISFSIPEGECVALIGPNGSGKTTLMKILSGVFQLKNPNTDGICEIDGRDVLKMQPLEIAKNVAYVGTDPLPLEFPLTVHEVVSLGQSVQARSWWQRGLDRGSKQIVSDALKRCGCLVLQNRQVSTLSAGERQLVSFARGIAQGARILLLDEAFGQLDLENQSRVGRILESLLRDRFTILIVTHDLNFISEFANRVLLLKSGQIVFDGGIEAAFQKDLLKKIYPNSLFEVFSKNSTGRPKVFLQMNGGA